LRMQDREGARTVHRELGDVLRERFQGWNAAVLTGAPELGMELGLRAQRTHSVWNGGIECRLLRIKVVPESVRAPGTLGKGAARCWRCCRARRALRPSASVCACDAAPGAGSSTTRWTSRLASTSSPKGA